MARSLARIGVACSLWLVAAAAGASPSLAADAVWTKPLVVSPVADYAQYSQDAASNVRGDALVAWWGVDGAVIGYARRTAGGTFTPARTLPSRGDSPRTAMNARGDAAVVWREGFGARGAFFPAGGGAPVPFTVRSGTEDCTAGSVGVGVDDTGGVMAFWNDCGRAWYARRSPAGAWSTPRAIRNPAPYADSMAASVAGNGSAIVAWKDYHGIYAATAPSGGSFSTTVLEANNNSSALYYDPKLQVPAKVYVATNARGDAAVSWMHANEYWLELVMATTKPAGQPFRRPQVLQTISPTSWDSPVDIDAQGRASVVWAGNGVQVATSNGTAFGAPQQASPKGACQPDVASSAQGDVTVVWNYYENGCQGDTGWEFAATRPAGAAKFQATKLVVIGQDAVFPPVVVGSGPHGALAAWVRGRLAPSYRMQVEVAQTAGP
jgi:hypothetical protein